MTSSHEMITVRLIRGVVVCVLGVTTFKADASQPLAIDIPPWVAGPQCVLQDSAHTATPLRGSRIQIDCSNPRPLLRCSFVGAEPVDIPVEEVCTKGGLPLRRGDPIMVRTTSGGSLEVEWLEINQLKTTLLAKRSFATIDGASLFVERGRQRLVRFRRAGVSPVSVAAEVMGERWSLPEPRPGGELVAVIADGAVLPEFYRLSGPWADSIIPQANRTIALQGLPPGEYALAPVYHPGLIEGAAQRFRVSDADSTVVFLGQEPVGGVDIWADDSVCSQTSELQLIRVEMTRQKERRASVTTRRNVFQIPHEGRCVRRIVGLKPGHYELALNRDGRAVVKDLVEITEQRMSPIRFAALGVYVSGRVLSHDKALESAVLEFTPLGEDITHPLASAVADAFGIYRADLPKAGTYRVTLRSTMRLPGQARILNVSEGVNFFDWNIDTSTLAVRIIGWNYGYPVMLTLTQVEPVRSGFFEVSQTVEPEKAEETVIEGLPEGKYAVQAVQMPRAREGRQRVSPRVSVTIKSEQKVTRIELALAEYDAVLVLRNSEGELVSGARIRYEGSLSAPEKPPGTYSLRHARPGSEVVISADGLAPSCRLAPAPDRRTSISRLEHTLTRGRRIDIEFVGSSELPIPPGFILWSGAECPIPLDRFAFAIVRADNKIATRFVVEDFPFVDRFTYIPSFFSPKAEWQETSVSRGIIQIEVPREVR